MPADPQTPARGPGRSPSPGGGGPDDAPFEITTDGARHLLTMTMRGTWDALIFDQFAAAYIHAIEALSASGGVTHQLVDASAFPVQPAEVARRFPALIEAAHYPACQRTACVIRSAANRAQAREGGDIVNARYFSALDDALDWLFGSEA